ncbi:MAG: hypothetical protein KH828_14100 [Clostridiales bacterium]|nr:hypothetical protein [Clostridiales bacterium]
MAEHIYPRFQLHGTDLLERTGVIFSQILNDLLMKVDDGEEDYPKGFFHTSTTTITEPNYYDQMWSRDVGRGIQELVRLGFLEEAQSAVDFILDTGKNFGNHYGRTINRKYGSHEVDGNVSVLMGIYLLWKYTGAEREKGLTYLENAMDIFRWFEELSKKCPYGELLASQSELSGNPEADYFIYALFATYGAAVTCLAYAEMAEACQQPSAAAKLTEQGCRLRDSLTKWLVSNGPEGEQDTKTPAGVWLNGIDERTGKAAETGDFGPLFDISKWTRQLPFIQDFDMGKGGFSIAEFEKINRLSYEYISREMAKGYYFRKYGFVSNTCFGGMGGRHDDTMAGYGQNYFSQAALLFDDVNVYTKCIEGIDRLAYDGDIVAPMTVDLNPWVMHECFTYENYEQGLDHTFGRLEDKYKHIMYNPGDEGNLVQSAETLKTLAMVAGIYADGDTLTIMPRLPWECTKAEMTDFPVAAPDGSLARISYVFDLERWKNAYTLRISGLEKFQKAVVRIGPLPNILCNEKELKEEWQISRQYGASFAVKTISCDGENELEIFLKNEKR